MFGYLLFNREKTFYVSTKHHTIQDRGSGDFTQGNTNATTTCSYCSLWNNSIGVNGCDHDWRVDLYDHVWLFRRFHFITGNRAIYPYVHGTYHVQVAFSSRTSSSIYRLSLNLLNGSSYCLYGLYFVVILLNLAA